MSTPGDCPRCRKALVADGADGVLSCDDCRGTFVPGTVVEQDLLSSASVSPGSQAPLTCPGCAEEMTVLGLDGFEIDQCGSCHGVWLDDGESLQITPAASISRYLLYSFTLPERIVRSTVGMAAGVAQETASLIVPQAFQSAKTYQVVIRNSLKFLTRDIGGVVSNGEQADETPTGDDYLARKAIGNFVDLAGMATLHVSPLWMMAILSDVAYGSKAYVTELAAELEAQGLIDRNSTIHHVDDVLDAIQNASGEAAGLFDSPPLSVDALRQTLDRTRAAIGSADYTSILPEAEMRAYWNEMREVSSREGVSLLGVSGALTMNTLNRLGAVTQGALTGVQVAGGLLSRHVVGHYVDSMQTIVNKGLYTSLRESSAPYVAALWNNFSQDRGTWTEELLSGRAIAKGWNRLSGWLTARKATSQTPAAGIDDSPQSPPD